MKKSTRAITEGFKLKDNENSTYQNLLDTSKAVLIEFLALCTSIRKEGFKIDDQRFYLKKLEKIKTKPKANGRSEIIVNEMK